MPKSILILALFLSISCSNVLIGQMTLEEGEIPWKEFVHIDFKFSMPVSKTNLRPVKVPVNHSFIHTHLKNFISYDLINYSGANEEFYSTVQLTAFGEEVNVEGMATKLMQLFKSDFEEVQDMTLQDESIVRVADQRKIMLTYRGDKELYTIIVFVSGRRAMTLLLSDVSIQQHWTNKFLDNFILLD